MSILLVCDPYTAQHLVTLIHHLSPSPQLPHLLTSDRIIDGTSLCSSSLFFDPVAMFRLDDRPDFRLNNPDLDLEREEEMESWVDGLSDIGYYDDVEDDMEEEEEEDDDYEEDGGVSGSEAVLPQKRRLSQWQQWRMVFRLRIKLVSLWKLFDVRRNEWWSAKVGGRLLCSYDGVYCTSLAREVMGYSPESYTSEDYEKSAQEHRKVSEMKPVLPD